MEQRVAGLFAGVWPCPSRRNSDTEQLVGPLSSFLGLDSEVSHIAVICPTEWRELGSKLENSMESRRASSPESPAVNMELYSAPQLTIPTGVMLKQSRFLRNKRWGSWDRVESKRKP